EAALVREQWQSALAEAEQVRRRLEAAVGEHQTRAGEADQLGLRVAGLERALAEAQARAGAALEREAQSLGEGRRAGEGGRGALLKDPRAVGARLDQEGRRSEEELRKERAHAVSLAQERDAAQARWLQAQEQSAAWAQERQREQGRQREVEERLGA